MGGCFSSEISSSVAESSSLVKEDKSFANVVYLDGCLRRYSLPIRVFQVLDSESGVFLCNSDSLSFDDYIPKLAPDDRLQPAQIYFILPVSKLNYRVTGRDMAALAVKASVALQNYNKNTRLGKSKARISPVVVTANEVRNDPPQSQPRVQANGISGSGSVRKLQRFSSRRAKLAVRSFKLRLNTIYEGSILVFG